MRAIDAEMYLVLSMRSFTRGPPMIPSTSEDSFQISAGEPLGLVSWSRFQEGRKFHLSDYLRSFMEHLGHHIETYDCMDGQKLVPYQCVVVRSHWDCVRPMFLEAFRVQKAAYRHANGGTCTPALIEDGRPRVASAHKNGAKAAKDEDLEVMTFFV